MLNVLSYVGMNLQAELCLWTLLGLLRTIFDATLFRVNANLKQVWQMEMPAQLSMPVQRGLRTMVSGVMLVKCFTVYVYLAAYIILLYPVFLEERPTLVLPWLLLAAVRRLLCELTSLALGLGACALLGPARPPCVRFVIFKIASITPAFYMWMLVFSYYSNLKAAATFQLFSAVADTSAHDCLELAVRRRRTKSLLDEDVLRRNLVANFTYGESTLPPVANLLQTKPEEVVRMIHSTSANPEEIDTEIRERKQSTSAVHSDAARSDMGSYEDWFGADMVVPRDADRILEQFVIMMLRIGLYINPDSAIETNRLMRSRSRILNSLNNIECPSLPTYGAETPPMVGNFKGRVASYVQKYPQIFMKKPSASDALQISNELNLNIQNQPVEIAALTSINAESNHSITSEQIFLPGRQNTAQDKQQNTGNSSLDALDAPMLPLQKEILLNSLDDPRIESHNLLEGRKNTADNYNVDKNEDVRELDEHNANADASEPTTSNIRPTIVDARSSKGTDNIQFCSVKSELETQHQKVKTTASTNPMEIDQINSTLKHVHKTESHHRRAYEVRSATAVKGPVAGRTKTTTKAENNIKLEDTIAQINAQKQIEIEMALDTHPAYRVVSTSSSDLTSSDNSNII